VVEEEGECPFEMPLLENESLREMSNGTKVINIQVSISEQVPLA